MLNVISYSYETYSEEIRKFDYSEWIGAAIAFVPLLPIPLFALIAICSSCRTPGLNKKQKFKAAFKSPMHYDLIKNPDSVISSQHHTPRYSSTAPGYVLLPQNPAPLAEPEQYNEQNRNSVEVKVVNFSINNN